MELDVDRIIEAIRSGTVSQAEAVTMLSGLAERVQSGNGHGRVMPETGAQPAPALVGSLQQLMAETLDLEPSEIDPDANLSEYGFDSTTLVEFAQAIMRRHPFVRLEPTTFLEHPSLSALVRWILTRHGDDVIGDARRDEPPSVDGLHASEWTPPKACDETPAATRVVARDDAPIAIVGLAGRFPRSESVTALWRGLVAGQPLVTEVPPDRWRWQEYFGDPGGQENRTDCYHGAFLDDVACFDATHFGISTDEARLMDPQHRLVLEVTWEALETAGYSRSALAGARVGVFVGTEKQEYLDLIKASGCAVGGHAVTGNAPALLPNRVSHFFDWKGPSVTINTGCSSSLAAIDAGLTSLRRGEVDFAIASGINLMLTPWLFIVNRRLRLLTGDGAMKPFDRRAAGHLDGEGVAVVVLKRLDDAVSDRDLIYAVIKGASVRHGGRSLFLTGRSPESHREVVGEALQRSGLEPHDIDYVEAQGMADPVVDRTELMAYHAVFGRGAGHRVAIGSSGGVLGHLGTASGVTALVKGVLSLRNNLLTPIYGLDTLNWSESDAPFGCAPVTRAEPWPPKIVDGRRAPRRFGVHNFGLGGVHTHVIVEEWLKRRPTPLRAPVEAIVVLSARTKRQVLDLAGRLHRFLTERTYEVLGVEAPTIAEIAYTLQVGRDAMECRAAFVVRRLGDLIQQLEAFAAGDATDDRVYGDCSRAAQAGESAVVADVDDPRAVARAWIHGSHVDWTRLWPDGVPSRIPLPTYPFEKQRHWIGSAAGGADTTVTREASARCGVSQTAVGDAHAGGNGPETSASMASGLKRLIAAARGIDERWIGDDTSLVDLGFDSAGLRSFATVLSGHVGIEINPALFFSHSTVRRLSRYLADAQGVILPRSDGAATIHAPQAPSGRTQAAANAPPPAPSGHACPEPIAVIGMAGRFPGANSVDELWRLLSTGGNAVREIPPNRFQWRDLYMGPGDPRNQITTNRGGFIEGIEEFDPLFFDISPREAELMDPRHRLLLEESWRALEDAALPPRRLRGRSVGMFAGVEEGDFDEVCGKDVSLTGNHPGVLTARLSYFLDLRGPSLAINTSCSSGLVALHQACQALQRDECELALVAGVSLLLGPTVFRQLSQMGMLSPSGQCLTFDNRADGIVPADAVVVLVLEKLTRAVADEDRIHGVVRATGINGDGRSNGITAPNGDAQRTLIERTYERHGIGAGELTYVLAHGTGTRLGDPVEVNALRAAFERQTDRRGFCALGSVKTNIGHSFAASGLVSVVAALQAMRRRQIPPSLYCERENEYLELERSAFYINKEARPWEPPAGVKRAAAVSAFGISGTNAHVVVEEYAEPAVTTADAVAASGDGFVFPLSARTEESLLAQARQLLRHLESSEQDSRALADVAFTLQVGRELWEERVAFVVRDAEELTGHLRDFAERRPRRPGCFHNRISSTAAGDLGPLFESDAEMDEIVSRWIEKRRLTKLAALWVRGVPVNWDALYKGGAKPRRVSLPAYPFARRRCWPRRTADLEPGASPGPDVDRAASPVPGPMPAAAPAATAPARPGQAPAPPAPPPRTPLTDETAVARVTLTPLRRRAAALALETTTHVTDAQLTDARAIDLYAAKTRPPDHAQPPPLARVTTEELEAALTTQLANVLFLEPGELDGMRKFIDLGLDSILAVEWVNAINRTYGIRMAATELYDHATLRDLARWLTRELSHTTPSSEPGPPTTAPAALAAAPVGAGAAPVVTAASGPGDGSLQDLLRRLAAEELSVDDAERLLASMPASAEPSIPASEETRDRVLRVLEGSVRAVLPGLGNRPLTDADSLADLGASSADRADIVVMTMEALALDVPCVELHGARNVGELADLFLQHMTCVKA